MTSTGILEVIAGGMFSGKSEELLRRLRRVTIANRSFIAFKPDVDTRSGTNKIQSNTGLSILAHDLPKEHPETLMKILEKEEKKHGRRFDVIAFDEAQFFPRTSTFLQLAMLLVERGYRVIVAGLDLDFRGEPFGAMPDLMALASRVDKLSAVCKICGEEAHFSQRLINEEPAPYHAPQVVIGSDETYEARCGKCFEVPGRLNILE